MTELKKPVRRSAVIPGDYPSFPEHRERVIVTLYPDKTVGFREYKKSREYRLPLAECLRMAILAYNEAKKRQGGNQP